MFDVILVMLVLAGVLGAIIWNLITWYYGLPSSSSHAIIGSVDWYATHIITSTILGVGLSKRMSAVDWTVSQRIPVAWVLTIPAPAIVACACYLLMSPLFVQ